MFYVKILEVDLSMNHVAIERSRLIRLNENMIIYKSFTGQSD